MEKKMMDVKEAKEVSEAQEVKAASKAKKPTTFYTAKGGETLTSVANKYGTSAESLGKLNKLTKDDVLSGGQVIAIS